MGTRFLLPLAAALALAAPGSGAAEGDAWSFTAGVWGGVSRYDVLGLKHGLGEVEGQDGRDLLDGDLDVVGGSAVLRVRWFEVGALYEGTLLDSDATSEVFTPLVGLALDLTSTLRLEALAELGGHRIQGIGSGGTLLGETRTVWLPYLGLRPSLSFRMPLGPARLVLSATPFARWDLVRKDVTVDTSSGADQDTTYEAGGSTFGLVGGVGIEL